MFLNPRQKQHTDTDTSTIPHKQGQPTEEAIRHTAYLLWEADGKPEGKDEDYWFKAIEKLTPQKSKHHPLLKPFVWVERCLESVLAWMQGLAILKILGLLTNVTLVVGLIAYTTGEGQRRNTEVYQAWQVITAAYDQPGSGGRIEALEFLNSRPLRFPWIGFSWDDREERWLLGRRWRRQSLTGLSAPNAYLSGVQLPYADLTRANLAGVDLRIANLEGAALESANLTGAWLESANLMGAWLGRANLTGAWLGEVNLAGALLWGANLERARLERANLAGSSPWEANLEGAELWGANLAGAWLERANLERTRLWEANLAGAWLREANLAGAELWAANLEGAELWEANLEGAELWAANLARARLESANLEGTKLLEAATLEEASYTGDSTSKEVCKSIYHSSDYPCPTIFPEGFDPQAAGMVLITNQQELEEWEKQRQAQESDSQN